MIAHKVSSYEDAKCQLRSDPATAWAAYVAGGAVVLARELGVDWARACPGGLRLLLQSSVPEGKGVSSSAALEVATLSALLQLLKKSEERDLCPDLAALAPSDVALLAQRVENDVVGAPCGVMDQMASCVGREDSLLVLQCRPARLLPGASLGSHLSTWGLDSGVAHCVGGADYGAVRTAAFMGRAIIRRRMQELRLEGEQAGPAAGGFQDANAWWEALSLGDRPAKRDDASSSQTLEYLTQLSPSEFEARWESALPERMTGAEFIDEFGSHDDPATTIDRDAVYHVRTCTAHPIYENFRVHCFKEVLGDGGVRDFAAALDSQMSKRAAFLAVDTEEHEAISTETPLPLTSSSPHPLFLSPFPPSSWRRRNSLRRTRGGCWGSSCSSRTPATGAAGWAALAPIGWWSWCARPRPWSETGPCCWAPRSREAALEVRGRDE